MPAAKIPHILVEESIGAVCKGCKWYSTLPTAITDAVAHHQETLHVVKAQVRETKTYTWSPG